MVVAKAFQSQMIGPQLHYRNANLTKTMIITTTMAIRDHNTLFKVPSAACLSAAGGRGGEDHQGGGVLRPILS